VKARPFRQRRIKRDFDPVYRFDDVKRIILWKTFV
jgi:hypothetical protein